MTFEPTHRYSGTPLREWMAAVPNELEIDAVGLWQIIPVLRGSSGLKDAALDRATREVLASLLARRARPVVGSAADGGSWHEVTRYGDDPEEIANAVIAEWHATGRDPDVEDTWFALPDIYKSPA